MASTDAFKRSNEDKEVDIGSPVDFSFKNMTDLKAIGLESGPRSTRIGRIPERGTEHRKYLTRSIWLNNNKLTNIRNMDELVNSILEQPEKLGWIDFSFNYITELDESILKFPSISIIYLHGNQIKDMDQVLKLRGLSKLRSLTLHGNPIADENMYRMCIITYLPQVVNLDFTPITNLERYQPKPAYALKKLETLIAKSA